jgi:putative transposase
MRKRYSGDFKVQVVFEYIEGKQTLEELAAEHQIHPNQIKNWKCTLMKRAHEVLDDRRVHLIKSKRKVANGPQDKMMEGARS